MNILIVFAHPEPKSFNGAMKDMAVGTLTKEGHQVQVSDLYAMNFKSNGDQQDFKSLSNPDYFKFAVEQHHAYDNGLLTEDIVAEQEKLQWCDFLILQFPLWWFSLPAILKGWVDRVFTTEFAYGGGKSYDNGGLKGRKTMLSLTTGGPEKIYQSTSLNGDIHQILFPINHGILFFVGFEVLPPYIAWSPARLDDEQRKQLLSDYQQTLLKLDKIEPINYPKLADYDDQLQLKTK
ncbi:MAG: NAD(P)H-dependent oxidoreductase [Okeania sp. SIO3B3]|nr:NAD(P)H-dependent oxidoreductase [Okeania sp. SIO3B3]